MRMASHMLYIQLNHLIFMASSVTYYLHRIKRENVCATYVLNSIYTSSSCFLASITFPTLIINMSYILFSCFASWLSTGMVGIGKFVATSLPRWTTVTFWATNPTIPQHYKDRNIVSDFTLCTSGFSDSSEKQSPSLSCNAH